MEVINKKNLSERDICSKFISPALEQAGWDGMSQIREEVSFTAGRIIVRGKLVTRGKAKRADYILYYKPNIPIAVIEAKDNTHALGDGMQRALGYAKTLDIPFVFSSNGDAFLFHDRTGRSPQIEYQLALDAFPSPAQLWARFRSWKGLAPEQEEIVLQDYHDYRVRSYVVTRHNSVTPCLAPMQDYHDYRWVRSYVVSRHNSVTPCLAPMKGGHLSN